MGAPVVHFEVLGKDGKKLQSFFQKLFNWEIKADNPMNYGEVKTGGGGINGGVGPSFRGPGHVTVYVQVPDLPACLDQATPLGRRTLMPPMQVTPTVQIAH